MNANHSPIPIYNVPVGYGYVCALDVADGLGETQLKIFPWLHVVEFREMAALHNVKILAVVHGEHPSYQARAGMQGIRNRTMDKQLTVNEKCQR